MINITTKTNMDTTNNNQNLKENLKRLSLISDWFDKQQEIDVEQGIVKVKEAGELIKASKARLIAIENEFEEIKKQITSEIGGE